MTSVLRGFASTAFTTERYAVQDLSDVSNTLYHFAATGYNLSMVPISVLVDASFSLPSAERYVYALPNGTAVGVSGDVLVSVGSKIVFTSTANVAVFGQDEFVKLYLLRNPARSVYLRVPKTPGVATTMRGITRLA